MTIILFLVELIIFLVLFALLYYFCSMLISDFIGAPFVPTTNRSIQNIFANLTLKKKDVFYDLGCGDGRLVFFVSQQFGCKGIGVEKNPLLHWYSCLIKKLSKNRRVNFLREDIFKVNLKNATVIYLFLFPEIIEQLKKQMLLQCAKNTLVISHGFKIKGWEKKLILYKEARPFSTYYYRI